MNDEILELLDYLAVCRSHLANDQFSRLAYWEAEFERTADDLADAWEAEMADAHS